MKFPWTKKAPAKKKGSKAPKQPQKLTTKKQSYDQLGHKVADVAREQNINTARETGDAASRYDRQSLVGVARQAYDENLVYATIIDRMTANLVGADGFGLQARTGDPELNAKIENEIFPKFTQNPEYRELWSWANVQKGVCKDMLGVGDIGFIKLVNGQLQAIESEWIANPVGDIMRRVSPRRKIEQGIEQTLGGKVTAFWHNPPSPEGYPGVKGTRIDKKDFIYVNGDIQRFSRTRPLPPFIQMMSSIWRLDDILDSEAVCWQLLAKIAFIVNKDNSDEDAFEDSEERSDAEAYDLADRFQDIGTGLVMHGNQGDNVTGVNRNLPGKEFPQSVRAFMQMFSMRCGLPLEILMLDWSKTNFSSGKAALTQAAVNIHSWQKNEVEQFCQPVYEWVIRKAIEDGELEWTPTILDHEWFPPMPPWIDAKEEAESWGIRVDRSLVTFSDALKAQGKDRDEENERRESDIRDAIERAKKLTKETGTPVDWKLFCGYLVGKTENAVNANGDTPQPEANNG